MFFYLLFRFWFTLARWCYAFCQVWMPTNQLVRWLDTDRGIAWGLPVGAALTPLYYLVMTWSGTHLSVGGTAWWWVPTLWAALNAIKFTHVAIRSPFAWAHRMLHRRAARRVDACRRRPAA